jgi:phosphoribosylglycinamide formyltransferase 1
MMNIAVFVSGNGSNLQALLEAEKQNMLGCGNIQIVVCDKPGAYAIERAKDAEKPVYLQEATGFATREEYDQKIVDRLKAEDIDLIVLAGFMRILSPVFIKSYQGKIINIHPAILPSFKGAHGIKDAYEHGVKSTGVTVHFVTEDLDDGPIILQEEVKIDKQDTLVSLEEKIHKTEHRVYPESVKLFVEGKLSIEGRKVVVREP